MKSGKMAQDELNKARQAEARELTNFYSGAKIILPFLFTLLVCGGGWYLTAAKASEEKGELNQRVLVLEEAKVELKSEVKYLRTELNSVKLAMTELKSDVKHIKEDTKETLDLVRDWTGRNRN